MLVLLPSYARLPALLMTTLSSMRRRLIIRPPAALVAIAQPCSLLQQSWRLP